MKTITTSLLIAAVAAFAACKKKEAQAQAAPEAPAAEAKVDNAATRYTSALQADVQKAQAAADKANAAIRKTNAGVNQATDAQ